MLTSLPISCNFAVVKDGKNNFESFYNDSMSNLPEIEVSDLENESGTYSFIRHVSFQVLLTSSIVIEEKCPEKRRRDF